MSEFLLTPDAQADLIDIRRYSKQNWGANQSKEYLSALRSTIKLIAATPALGKLRPDVGHSVRSFPHASHVIYYVIHEGTMIVFGVLHKRMLPHHHILERDPTTV